MPKHVEALLWQTARWLGGGGEDGESFGVHITFDDLYHSVLFFTCIYVGGKIATWCKMPSLVGEIFTGILLGPPLADFVPNPEAFVMLGEIGLILLVLEAGIDIDLTTLKLIGTRGVAIALVGSILPILFGFCIAMALGTDVKGSIAAGACFGPTSLGIAMNILRQGKIVNTPVGQLIVSAAVIDDMIALIILSQLEALTDEITAKAVLIPVVSALAYLGIGGYIAVYILPPFIEKYILSKIDKDFRGKMEMVIMFGLLIGLMPATYYCEASFLVGAFISGLTFCRSHDLHAQFGSQFKRVLQWLMRIFFAASIGFQVPIKDFGSGTIIGQGLFFTLALAGKLLVGFMVPNFNQTKRFTGLHFRDVLITGFSMAAEGEFAFVIAVFSVDSGLFSKSLYASIVLAVLLSTIFPPFALRFTIGYYNRKSEELVRKAAEEELQRQVKLGSGGVSEMEEMLREEIKRKSAFFMCIQTQSNSKWGLLPHLMNAMKDQGLEIIDHRSWHARGVDSALINEIYARDLKNQQDPETAHNPEERMEEVKAALEKVIDQPGIAKVKVNRWYPGIVEEIVEEVESGKPRRTRTRQKSLVSDKIFKEAQSELEKKRLLQTTCTKEKTVDEILNETTPSAVPQAPTEDTLGVRQRPRRARQKMRSTPVVGGNDMFGTFSGGGGESTATKPSGKEEGTKKAGAGANLSMFAQGTGHPAELIIDGDSFKVRISNDTIKKIRSGYSGGMVDSTGISLQSAEPPVNYRLQGFVRNFEPLGQIPESTVDDRSEVSSNNDGANGN